MDNPSETTSILLIDDDMKYCRLINEYLSGFGYDVAAVHNGADGVKAALEKPWSALILDIMLPGIDGFEVLKRIRESSTLPVLMLTALGAESDRIVGLELGADDYLPKTASPRELLARLRALLRRVDYTRRDELDKRQEEEICVGPLSVITSARLALLDGEPLPLTPVEYDLLTVLVASKGRVKTREELLNEIRDRNYDAFDRSIDVHISALRKKLGDDPKQPRFIRTVRGSGYMLTPWSGERDKT